MPKIDYHKMTVKTGTIYPAPFAARMKGRNKSSLGSQAGLTQFGVNLTELEPGAMSALRHWHEHEDEFVYVLAGELTLIDDAGETPLKAGDSAGFKAGEPNGHHLVNKSQEPAVYLEIGSRSNEERAHYPDDDLAFAKTQDGFEFTHKDGTPYAAAGKEN